MCIEQLVVTIGVHFSTKPEVTALLFLQHIIRHYRRDPGVTCDRLVRDVLASGIDNLELRLHEIFDIVWELQEFVFFRSVMVGRWYPKG